MRDIKRKLLVVDDEIHNCELIEQVFAGQFQVLKALDAEDGLRLARTELPDIILLDVAMPKVDGVSICETLRAGEATRHIPVLMVTGVDEPECREKAFTAGADDFVAKPFRAKELIARVNSKVRRIEEAESKDEVLECGNLVLKPERLEASVAGQPIPLSVLEFELLKYFVKNRDRVVSRQKILESVWHDSIVTDRTVDTHIVSLRKKLKGCDYALGTVYGAGYVLKRSEAEGPSASAYSSGG